MKKEINPEYLTCPIRQVISRFGDKWSMLVLLTLQGQEEPMRFRDLCKAIPDVSQKMLTATLRELEADDLVSRKIYPEIPSRVEYALTKRGKSLLPLLNNLVEWSLENFDGILRSRKKYVKDNP